MELPPSRVPSGPGDPGPKTTVKLSPNQLRELWEFAGRHPCTIGIQDTGQAYLVALLYDPEAKAVEKHLLYPIGKVPQGSGAAGPPED